MPGLERFILTVTGPDHPGITAGLTRILAQAGAALLDVEQVVVQGNLILCLLVRFDESRRSAVEVLKDLLFQAKASGVNLDFRPDALDEPSRADRDEFVVTVIAPQIEAAHIHAVSERLAAHAANIDRIVRLTERGLTAVEIVCSVPAGDGRAPAELKRALLDLTVAHSCDLAIQPNTVHRRSKRLVVMDMDSTLIRIEVIDELARAAGKVEEVSAITRRAMAGEMDYDESLRRRVELLAGLDAAVLDRIAHDLPLTQGAETLIQTLRRLGYRTAVISGGFDVPARALKEKLGLDYAYSNMLEVKDGRLTGRVVGPVVNGQRKADLLEAIAQQERIPLDQTVAIGDGANDVPMIQKAGLGIAFHGKTKLREAAHSALSGGLDSVLYLLGISERELRRVG